MPYPIHTRADSMCTDCYRCLRKCKLKAIRFSNHQTKIMPNKCVLCGECVEECPQQTKVVVGDLKKVQKALENGDKLVLSLAETVVNFFTKKHPSQVLAKAKAAGFHFGECANVMEPTLSKMVADVLEKSRDFYISSHCAVVVNLIEQHYPQLIDHLMPTPTLATLHGRDLKTRFPDAKVVHVTSCIAELNHAPTRAEVDYMITFPDLQSLFFHDEKASATNDAIEASYLGGHSCTIAGHLVQKVRGYGVVDEATSESFSGMTSCLDILDHLGESDETGARFLELMACPSGCVNGYSLRYKGSILDRTLQLMDYETSLKDLPTKAPAFPLAELPVSFKARTYHQPKVRCEDVNKEFERFFGQEGLDILDCAACGYETCYEKSEAVIRGEAEREMCIAYLRKYAETYAASIVESSVNGLVVFDKDLTILEMNPTAEQIFKAYGMAVGQKIDQFIERDVVLKVVEDGDVVRAHNLHLDKVELFLQVYIMPLSVSETYLTIIVDVTGMMLQRQEMETMKADLLHKAEKVIDHQMQSAQEIARLLGETTAETKITLLELMHFDE